ncbi:MAG: prepilin-type N-terminal cleavage/methylation domain-containing protein [Planctomycetota bacterium]|jgi:prepilin-type N-terminal cleavage/methylation domain-containing protein
MYADMARKSVGCGVCRGTIKIKPPRGFTLIEVLVVISIISILIGILLPVLGNARRQARALLGMSNQRQIVEAVNLFASDNDESYPDSVATIGNLKIHWHWHEPTKLTGIEALSPQQHRAMSEYLKPYIKNAKTMFCPNAPKKYKYLQEAWDAGDEWDNPDAAPRRDSVSGTYCFWWNYIGWLGKDKPLFRGPRGPAAGRIGSKLLISCYFGYGHWRSPEAFRSCERLKRATVMSETHVSAAYWFCKDSTDGLMPEVKLHAGYTDGHVETFSSLETIPLRVSKTANGKVPYPDGIGSGIFYLPRNALR